MTDTHAGHVFLYAKCVLYSMCRIVFLLCAVAKAHNKGILRRVPVFAECFLKNTCMCLPSAQNETLGIVLYTHKRRVSDSACEKQR